MSELLKDFIKFVAEVGLILITLLVIFGEEGIGSNTFYYLAYIEPIVLQNWLVSSLTVGSHSPGDFFITTETTGQPYTIRIFTEDEASYVVIIPPEVSYYRAKFATLDPMPFVSKCEIKDQEIRLKRNIIKEISVRKIFTEQGCEMVVVA
jgi:hypothetical protein